MRFIIKIFLAICISTTLNFIPLSNANAFGFGNSAKVWIPEEEFLAYFDSNGIYTVAGNVKNENDFAVIPTITVSVKDDSIVHSRTIQHVPLVAVKEIPFKIKFP